MKKLTVIYTNGRRLTWRVNDVEEPEYILDYEVE